MVFSIPSLIFKSNKVKSKIIYNFSINFHYYPSTPTAIYLLQSHAPIHQSSTFIPTIGKLFDDSFRIKIHRLAIKNSPRPFLTANHGEMSPAFKSNYACVPSAARYHSWRGILGQAGHSPMSRSRFYDWPAYYWDRSLSLSMNSWRQ